MYIIISTQNKPCHLLSFNVCVYIERYVIIFIFSLLYSYYDIFTMINYI